MNFSDLRQSYKAVKDFLENESFEKVKSLETKIADDLGLWGDDNWDPLTKFVTTFALEQLVLRDKTLNDVFDLDYGEAADRDSIGGKWVRTKIDDEEEVE